MERPTTTAVPAEDLAACRRVLEALCKSAGALSVDDPELTEVVRLSALMLRKKKKAQRQDVRRRDEDLLDRTGIRDLAADVQALVIACDATVTPAPILSKSRECYICKRQFDRLHPFYDSLCPSCGDFNFDKRQQSADLHGRIALITGARVKIGFQVGLRLLRAGAHVIATTRFPNDAARRYASQPDAAKWASRLQLNGLDLRHLGAVEQFASAVAAEYRQLDVFIHNAAQTVRRPPAFYEPLLAGERSMADLSPLAQQMIGSSLPGWQASRALDHATPNGAGAHSLTAPQAFGIRSWAELSQVPLLPGDEHHDRAAFPEGALDADAQQVDLRGQNSWGMPLPEVSPIELLEVQAVNCLSPFLLLRQLDPLLRAGPDRDRFVVLVSAVEGQFGTRWKTGRHPHTNMAKAALNMITRTCAEAYAADRIFLTSVDTGWVTNEAAHPVAERMRSEGFRTPLDAEDGAARVLDPVFSGLNTGKPTYGVFLKDYRPASW